jgi:hypothetical protein
LHLLSKHLARVFCFYFAKKSQAEAFLDTVGKSVAKIHRQSLAVAPPYVDVDSDDEVEELVNLVRRVGIENEKPNKKAVDIEERGKKAVDIEAEDVEDEDEYDPTRQLSSRSYGLTTPTLQVEFVGVTILMLVERIAFLIRLIISI